MAPIVLRAIHDAWDDPTGAGFQGITHSGGWAWVIANWPRYFVQDPATSDRVGLFGFETVVGPMPWRPWIHADGGPIQLSRASVGGSRIRSRNYRNLTLLLKQLRGDLTGHGAVTHAGWVAPRSSFAIAPSWLLGSHQRG